MNKVLDTQALVLQQIFISDEVGQGSSNKISDLTIKWNADTEKEFIAILSPIGILYLINPLQGTEKVYGIDKDTPKYDCISWKHSSTSGSLLQLAAVRQKTSVIDILDVEEEESIIYSYELISDCFIEESNSETRKFMRL